MYTVRVACYSSTYSSMPIYCNIDIAILNMAIHVLKYYNI